MPVTAGLVARLINEALSEEDIRDIAFDSYRPVHDQYSAAMSRTELIRRLVDWCDRHRRLDELLDRVTRINPERSAAYADSFAARAEPPTAYREPFVVHPLPPAAEFVGRADDLRALEEFCESDGAGLFCLVALGGAGKTAMVAELLRRLQRRQDGRPQQMLVWSFYDSPDVQSFLATAQAYYAWDEPFVANTAPGGRLYQLMRALESAGPNLLVLDGLERVQRTHGEEGLLGEIADHTLSQIVHRLAAGLGRTKAIITTRMAVPRLERWLGRTYRVRDVASLTPDDACELLARNGVTGGRQALLELVEVFGAHALTLDHLGGYLRSFHGGSPGPADRLVAPVLRAADAQEHRLARVLGGYATVMDPRELALLSRLCVYRYAMTVPALHEVFATSPDERVAGPLAGLSEGDFQRILRRLARLHLVQAVDSDRWTVHPAVRDYFYLRFEQAGVVHHAVRKQYATLVAAPGTRLPRSEAELDGLEELVHHTLRVGRVDDAERIFSDRLGGVEHLAWHLGQYSRCIRVLQEFPRCPDTAGLIWCHRAVGDLAAAERLVAPDDAWWLGMLGCLRGRLAEVANLLAGGYDDPILTVCEVLTGAADPRALATVPVWPGLPVTVADAWLAHDLPDEAEAAAAELATYVDGRGRWSDELARIDLSLAEIARRRGDLGRCGSLLDKAGMWVLNSGSQEHLCQWNLLQGRLAVDLGRYADAATALAQGIHAAEHCGFGLLHIELRIESARLALAEGRPHAAAADAGTALGEARNPRCRYLPAVRRAGALLRQAEAAGKT